MEFEKLDFLLKKQSKWEQKKGVINGDFTKLSDAEIDEWLEIENKIDKCTI